jgi:hypothetical protein
VTTALRLCYRRFLRGDAYAGFELLRSLSRWIYPDYRFLDPRLDWWSHEAFNAYLKRFGEQDALNTERRWAVHELLRLTREVPGDTAECGAYLGAASFLICAANAGTDKTHHIFDSFEGLSAPGPQDGSYWRQGDMAASEQELRRNLDRFDRVELYRGWIPERFPEVEDRRFSFVHIDVDLTEPTAESIAFFYPRLERGGVLVCDDYGFATCPGATRAMDDYLAERPEKMLALPSGGGVVIKGVGTWRRSPTDAG